MPLVAINALDLEFVPSTLVARENQLEELRKLVVASTFSNENAWVCGGPGLGKTLTVKFLANEIDQKRLGKSFYMLCEKSIRNAINRVRVRYHLPTPKRDISASSLAQAMLKAYPDQRYYIIIDEPDKAYAKRDITNFVHCLWNVLIDENAQFSFIFVSKYDLTRTATIFGDNAADTISRLQLKPIIFPVYSAPEIVTILRQRLDLIMKPYQYDVAALYILAHHIHKVGGDMRQALEIMREAARIAGNQPITVSIVEQAVEWGKKTWWMRRLRSIGPHWALIVFLAASQCKADDSLSIDETVVIKLYFQAAAQYKVEPLGPSTVYWIIKQLSGSRSDGEPFFELKLEKWGLPAQVIFERGERDRIVSVGKTFDWEDLLTFG